MTERKNLSRREVTKRFTLAAGLTAFGSAVAAAIKPTPEQGEGPFHPVTRHEDTDADMTVIAGHTESAVGDTILVRGRVQDTEGNPIAGASVDIWQANHFGRYTHPDDNNTAPLDPNFQGWTLLKTGESGIYGIKTILPGPYPLAFLEPESKRWRCRHIHFKVDVTGYESLTTQMYFHGDPWIEHDGMVARTPEELRSFLIVKPRSDDETGLPLYWFDITLEKASTGPKV